ncbi:MAG TPA: immunoglobulin domain-containing protein, partial [Verrucomicrobiae bacterium]|nr:immunoglobulin domain-containing protein [Verrucomicrobiae bacterium]
TGTCLLWLAVPVAVFGDNTWTSISGLPGTDGSVSAIVPDGYGNLFIGGDFHAAGGVIANNVAKWNGSAWEPLGSGPGGYVNALVLWNGLLYAGGNFGVAYWDGSEWQPVGSGDSGLLDVYALAVSDGNLYAGGSFEKTIGDENLANIARWDGGQWRSVDYGLNGPVYALAAGSGGLYVGGDFELAGDILAGTLISAHNIACWDGVEWSALDYYGVSQDPDSYYDQGAVFAIAVNGDDVYVGGDFYYAGGQPAGNIARWNGSAWSSLGTGMDGGSVSELAISDGNLYAAGSFTLAGGIGITNIARWDGIGWSAAAPGLGSGGVQALAVDGGNIYAAGGFTLAGDNAAFHVARWDGGGWQALGSLGLVNPVKALAASDTALYALLTWTNHVSVWNGSQWASLKYALTGEVSVIAASGNKLYAGGNFTDGSYLNYIAEWNGGGWSPLASGLAGPPTALTASGTNLYAGGGFGVVCWNGQAWSSLDLWPGGTPVSLAVSGEDVYATSGSSVWWWDGTEWQQIGSTSDGAINSLAVSGQKLYAGGTFTTIDGVEANGLACWTDCGWSPVGDGIANYYIDSNGYWVSGGVFTLATSGDNLYAGGLFIKAGEIQATNIARWDGHTFWSAIGAGTDGTVDALAVSGDGLFVGGSFTTAGDKYSFGVAETSAGASSVSPAGAPIFCTQPQSQTVSEGDPVTFSVEVIGATPRYFQWLKNTVPIPDATNSSYTILNVQTNDAGDYQVFVYNPIGGEDSEQATLVVMPVSHPTTLKDALDAPDFEWTTGGDASWTGVQTTSAHDGLDAAFSGGIGGSQESWIETSVTGPGTISFWWQTSSETNFDTLEFSYFDYYSYFPVSISISGETGWRHQIVNVYGDGTYTFRWSYRKDATVSKGEDRAWLDQVGWQPMGPPAPTLTLLTFTPGSELTFNVQGLPDQTYRIQTSTNLIDWTDIFTNSSPDGEFPVSDFTTAGELHRYYRAVSP